jgi:hypothetical protein
MGPEERNAKILETAERCQAGLDIENGTLARVVYFHAGASGGSAGSAGRLLIVVHHLAVDGVSWRILVEDLETAYRQRARGKPVRLGAKTSSFKIWSERLNEHARGPDVENGAWYWERLAAQEAERLPFDVAGGANTESSANTITRSLTPRETEDLLQRVPKAYHTQINDLLLTALVQMFHGWTGKREVYLNRDRVEVDQGTASCRAREGSTLRPASLPRRRREVVGSG